MPGLGILLSECQDSVSFLTSESSIVEFRAGTKHHFARAFPKDSFHLHCYREKNRYWDTMYGSVAPMVNRVSIRDCLKTVPRYTIMHEQ